MYSPIGRQPVLADLGNLEPSYHRAETLQPVGGRALTWEDAAAIAV